MHGDDYPRYAPDQVARIADNILLYQRSDGGWIENQDPARILDADMFAALRLRPPPLTGRTQAAKAANEAAWPCGGGHPLPAGGTRAAESGTGQFVRPLSTRGGRRLPGPATAPSVAGPGRTCVCMVAAVLHAAQGPNG